ncbi:hypothetical protein Zmor_004502 [Zophobas morio]|jgi:hypothetical protein|uniref:Uncharacterized protein n=1 Tax=Zophobas morio TaxID=2755281 RepID=A0AA38HJ26_9CUCU|nr:hypothetical protein Zmor_004502 [Zophobas morio]
MLYKKAYAYVLLLCLLATFVRGVPTSFANDTFDQEHQDKISDIPMKDVGDPNDNSLGPQLLHDPNTLKRLESLTNSEQGGAEALSLLKRLREYFEKGNEKLDPEEDYTSEPPQPEEQVTADTTLTNEDEEETSNFRTENDQTDQLNNMERDEYSSRSAGKTFGEASLTNSQKDRSSLNQEKKYYSTENPAGDTPPSLNSQKTVSEHSSYNFPYDKLLTDYPSDDYEDELSSTNLQEDEIPKGYSTDDSSNEWTPEHRQEEANSLMNNIPEYPQNESNNLNQQEQSSSTRSFADSTNLNPNGVGQPLNIEEKTEVKGLERERRCNKEPNASSVNGNKGVDSNVETLSVPYIQDPSTQKDNKRISLTT